MKKKLPDSSGGFFLSEGLSEELSEGLSEGVFRGAFGGGVFGGGAMRSFPSSIRLLGVGSPQPPGAEGCTSRPQARRNPPPAAGRTIFLPRNDLEHLGFAFEGDHRGARCYRDAAEGSDRLLREERAVGCELPHRHAGLRRRLQ